MQTKTIQSRSWPWSGKPPKINIDAAGLVALADLSTIARRTALTGNACLTDIFVLCPGIHRQHLAPELHSGEYPAVAALTSGYIFRVENPATVLYLQSVGRTGELTNAVIEPLPLRFTSPWINTIWDTIFPPTQCFTWISTISYLLALALTVSTLTLLCFSRSKWGLAVFLILVFARFCNTVVIRRRVTPGWSGAAEPGVHGDLLVLLSQDR